MNANITISLLSSFDLRYTAQEDMSRYSLWPLDSADGLLLSDEYLSLVNPFTSSRSPKLFPLPRFPLLPDPSSTCTHLSHVGRLVQRSQRPTDSVRDVLFREVKFCWICHRPNITRYATDPCVHLFAPIPSAWSVVPGIVIALFFQCMTALLGSTNRMRKGYSWGLVAHTVALFSVATMSLAIDLFFLSVAYIDAREFPGADGLPSGPLGYLVLPKFLVLASISNSVIQVNQWLVDGLLVSPMLKSRPKCLTSPASQLYRCYIIYGMNYWAVAIPFVIYLASWGTCSNSPRPKAALTVSDYDSATGIAAIYADALSYSGLITFPYWNNAYYSIALSLNALLTLMLITRLVLHSKNIRRAMGDQDGASGLYKAIITMLVESGALHAASFVLFVGPSASGSIVQLATFPILPEIQVRTVFPLP